MTFNQRVWRKIHDASAKKIKGYPEHDILLRVFNPINQRVFISVNIFEFFGRPLEVLT